MDSSLWHKSIRLPSEHYMGCRWYFVTICSPRPLRPFQSKPVAGWLLRLLRQESTVRSFAISVYCLMPGHLHLLSQGISLNANLLRFIDIFKHKLLQRYWLRHKKQLWQVSFYDHILRDDEGSPNKVAWYIWLNPVRAGLVSKPTEDPLSGPFSSGLRAGIKASATPEH